jgi:hypothetical protein
MGFPSPTLAGRSTGFPALNPRPNFGFRPASSLPTTAPGRQKFLKNSSKKSGKDFKNSWQKLQKMMRSKTA